MTASISATFITDDRIRRPAASHPYHRPNYAARRVVAVLLALCALATVVSAVGKVGAWVDLGGAPAVASGIDPDAAVAPSVHVASAGDTLWSIAAIHHGQTDFERYLDALIRLNGDSTAITVGQAVRLP